MDFASADLVLSRHRPEQRTDLILRSPSEARASRRMAAARIPRSPGIWDCPSTVLADASAQGSLLLAAQLGNQRLDIVANGQAVRAHVAELGFRDQVGEPPAEARPFLRPRPP